MKLSPTFVLSALFLASTVPAGAQTAGPGYISIQPAQMQLAEKTAVPGQSLAPGSYSIRITDRLNDRIIVQVQRNRGKAISFLAYPNPNLRSGSFTGPVNFVSGIKGRPALRGFGFAGGPVVEFVYPKADAVDLAKSNSVRVMAVDPASEGRVNLPNLTQADMTEVTLWMLTPTPVDPTTSKPGIQAARYQAPTPTPADVASVAQTSAPIQPSTSGYYSQNQTTRTGSPHIASTRTPAVQVAASSHAPRLRPKVQELPHTAGESPLISLMACVSLFFGGVLTLRRLR
ncbi:MAG: hypothetical protein ACRYFU_18695 [Janthinobacterium lividum]